jgi:ankyrin repeat protein
MLEHHDDIAEKVHMASSNGSSVDVVACLLEAGAKKGKIATPSGFAPLHAASIKGDVEIVKTLLEAGAHKNRATKMGER